jgi:hypothetical protein
MLAKRGTQMAFLNFLFFKDLKDSGVVDNRTTLGRWQRDRGFPLGILLGPNTVGFREDEVIAWLESRPRQHTESVSDRDQERADRLRGNSELKEACAVDNDTEPLGRNREQPERKARRVRVGS